MTQEECKERNREYYLVVDEILKLLANKDYDFCEGVLQTVERKIKNSLIFVVDNPPLN